MPLDFMVTWQKEQKFQCRSLSAQPGKAPDENEIAVKHLCTSPEPYDPEVLKGFPEAFTEFYNALGELELYVDDFGNSGLLLAPIAQWPELTKDYEAWLFEPEIIEPWQDSCRVIGEIPCSGNYLLLRLDEEGYGQIWYFSHDDLPELFAENLEELLQLVNNPFSIFDAGFYPAYGAVHTISDGKTGETSEREVQWFPVKYSCIDSDGASVTYESNEA